MPDFNPYSESADSPARKLAAITPNDAADMTVIPKALWVAVAGTLSVVAESDTSNAGVSMGSLSVGTIVPVRCRRVRSSGTTATVIGLL